MFGARNVTNEATPLRWANIDGDAQSSRYGALPILIHNQTLVAQLIGQVGALSTAVAQLGGGGQINMAAIEAAAERGAADAVAALNIPTVDEIADAVNDDAATRMQG